ncbi:HEPN domain-containing protein [Arthrospiribacter ruber]|uniref:ApeA N-terminal domain 1-containing protein n=1 Tax=Arthrospiribacter ruber TaxID=2487934 RepID=UPI001C5B674B
MPEEFSKKPYLFGKLEDGKFFTVYNVKLESSRTGTGISKIGLIAEVLLKGDHISCDEKIIEGLTCKNQYLEDWADLRPVSVRKKKSESFELDVSIKIPQEIIFFDSENYKISLGHSISYPIQEVNSAYINPIPKISIFFKNNVDINKALELREALKLLFQLILNVEAGIENSFLKTNDDPLSNEIFVFENKIKWNYSTLNKRNILLDMNSFLGFSDDLISNWLEVFYENRDAIIEYYRISKSRNLVNKREVFMNSIQGLEMFYKIFFKDKKDTNNIKNCEKEDKLKAKIKSFLSRIPEIANDLIPDEKKFINKIVGTRNHFAHYNLFSIENDSNIIPKNLLGAYSKRIELINDLVLLDHLGIPSNIITERLHGHVHWHIFKDQNYILE